MFAYKKNVLKYDDVSACLHFGAGINELRAVYSFTGFQILTVNITPNMLGFTASRLILVNVISKLSF